MKSSTRTEAEKAAALPKIIMLVADSLMYQAIDEGIKRNVLPNIRFLMENGQYFPDFVSSFPTMSVTIDSTLFESRAAHPIRRIGRARTNFGFR